MFDFLSNILSQIDYRSSRRAAVVPHQDLEISSNSVPHVEGLHPQLVPGSSSPPISEDSENLAPTELILAYLDSGQYQVALEQAKHMDVFVPMIFYSDTLEQVLHYCTRLINAYLMLQLVHDAYSYFGKIMRVLQQSTGALAEGEGEDSIISYDRYIFFRRKIFIDHFLNFFFQPMTNRGVVKPLTLEMLKSLSEVTFSSFDQLTFVQYVTNVYPCEAILDFYLYKKIYVENDRKAAVSFYFLDPQAQQFVRYHHGNVHGTILERQAESLTRSRFLDREIFFLELLNGMDSDSKISIEASAAPGTIYGPILSWYDEEIYEKKISKKSESFARLAQKEDQRKTEGIDKSRTHLGYLQNKLLTPSKLSYSADAISSSDSADIRLAETIHRVKSALKAPSIISSEQASNYSQLKSLPSDNDGVYNIPSEHVESLRSQVGLRDQSSSQSIPPASKMNIIHINDRQESASYSDVENRLMHKTKKDVSVNHVVPIFDNKEIGSENPSGAINMKDISQQNEEAVSDGKLYISDESDTHSKTSNESEASYLSAYNEYSLSNWTQPEPLNDIPATSRTRQQISSLDAVVNLQDFSEENGVGSDGYQKFSRKEESTSDNGIFARLLSRVGSLFKSPAILENPSMSLNLKDEHESKDMPESDVSLSSRTWVDFSKPKTLSHGIRKRPLKSHTALRTNLSSKSSSATSSSSSTFSPAASVEEFLTASLAVAQERQRKMQVALHSPKKMPSGKQLSSIKTQEISPSAQQTSSSRAQIRTLDLSSNKKFSLLPQKISSSSKPPKSHILKSKAVVESNRVKSSTSRSPRRSDKQKDTSPGGLKKSPRSSKKPHSLQDGTRASLKSSKLSSDVDHISSPERSSRSPVSRTKLNSLNQISSPEKFSDHSASRDSSNKIHKSNVTISKHSRSPRKSPQNVKAGKDFLSMSNIESERDSKSPVLKSSKAADSSSTSSLSGNKNKGLPRIKNLSTSPLSATIRHSPRLTKSGKELNYRRISSPESKILFENTETRIEKSASPSKYLKPGRNIAYHRLLPSSSDVATKNAILSTKREPKYFIHDVNSVSFDNLTKKNQSSTYTKGPPSPPRSASVPDAQSTPLTAIKKTGTAKDRKSPSRQSPLEKMSSKMEPINTGSQSDQKPQDSPSHLHEHQHGHIHNMELRHDPSHDSPSKESSSASHDLGSAAFSPTKKSKHASILSSSSPNSSLHLESPLPASISTRRKRRPIEFH